MTSGQNSTKHLPEHQQQLRNKGTEPAGSSQHQVPWEKGCKEKAVRQPPSPNNHHPCVLFPWEASYTSSFLHPHFRKIRLNIAECARMSQL